jgi:hypothetical protein
MIVESMNDHEFASEVITDFFAEMNDYVQRALSKKKIKSKHSSNYTSKRRNEWFIIYGPANSGQWGIHVKRPQPKEWFTWYSLMFVPPRITLFGFNKHVAQRISQRYHPELTPTNALKEMLVKTPAIIQSEVGDSFYTRVNGGICLGSVFGKRMLVNVRGHNVQVELRETKTFISDDQLGDDQRKVTDESIARAINRLGKDYLSDQDREDFSE